MANFKRCLTKKTTFVFIPFFIFFLLFFFFSFKEYVCSSDKQKYSLLKAKKVLNLINKIRTEQYKENPGTLRKIVIKESELNSYIAYRIEVEKEEIMKELCLKLFEANKIEGKIFIDLTGRNIPKMLNPQMTFYFEGKLQVEESRVRLNMKKLYLEEQLVPPLLLDLIIYISSKIEKVEASSINDWYELPFGIKNIETHFGQAVFFY